MASTRLRVYDVINNFQNDENFFLELYKPWKKYDIVIFQKSFDEKALRLAQKLKSQGVKIILDVNVNFYDKNALDKKYPDAPKQIAKFTKLCDHILTTTAYLKDYIQDLYPKKYVTCIPENISSKFFSTTKNHSQKVPTLLYVGYAVKAKEVLLVEDILKDLKKRHRFNLLFICEKNPNIEIEGIELSFIKYNQQKIHKQMLLGDIFISPRDISDPYNLGHSFSKIGYPMSIGIPVIADKIPSYADSPAFLCDDKKDWAHYLETLINDPELRTKMGSKGIQFCKENFSSEVIKEQYINFLTKISNES